MWMRSVTVSLAMWDRYVLLLADPHHISLKSYVLIIVTGSPARTSKQTLNLQV